MPTDYECPTCGAPIAPSTTGETVICGSCGREIPPAFFEEDREVLTPTEVIPDPYGMGSAEPDLSGDELRNALGPNDEPVFDASRPEEPRPVGGGTPIAVNPIPSPPPITQGGPAVPPTTRKGMAPWLIALIVVLVLCLGCGCLGALAWVFNVAEVQDFSRVLFTLLV